MADSTKIRVARSQPAAGTRCPEDEGIGEDEHAEGGPAPPAAVCSAWLALEEVAPAAAAAPAAAGCGGSGDASGSRVMSATKAVARPLPLSYRGCCRTMSMAEGAKSQAYTRKAALVWGRKRRTVGQVSQHWEVSGMAAPTCGVLAAEGYGRYAWLQEQKEEVG